MPAMRAVFLSDVMAASSLPGMLHGSTRAWHGEVGFSTRRNFETPSDSAYVVLDLKGLGDCACSDFVKKHDCSYGIKELRRTLNR